MDYGKYRRAGAHMFVLWAVSALAWLSDALALVLNPDGALYAKLASLNLLLPFACSVILLTMAGWNRRYLGAGCCLLASSLARVASEHPDMFTSRTATAVIIAFYFMGALAEYFECSAHGAVFAFIMQELRRGWGRIWTWYIWTLAAVLLGRILVKLLPGANAAVGAVSVLAMLAQRSGKLALLFISARNLAGRPRG